MSNLPEQVNTEAEALREALNFRLVAEFLASVREGDTVLWVDWIILEEITDFNSKKDKKIRKKKGKKK